MREVVGVAEEEGLKPLKVMDFGVMKEWVGIGHGLMAMECTIVSSLSFLFSWLCILFLFFWFYSIKQVFQFEIYIFQFENSSIYWYSHFFL